MNKIVIELKEGVYLINEKKYIDCNPDEQEFFNRFIISQRELINKILYLPPVDVEILK